ncbi:hypothetical protein LMG29739_05077 [Paraburkholderia solisilvae]|uniref:Uncharacterized protein n=1 Tax=Paraburkholderia solisilvae TaxID=624376 RepID=A0A6J5EQG6_9BURK|nr:hypothetical protein LMG29739_05077 [Paraburkholderia solisilvae]
MNERAQNAVIDIGRAKVGALRLFFDGGLFISGLAKALAHGFFAFDPLGERRDDVF